MRGLEKNCMERGQINTQTNTRTCRLLEKNRLLPYQIWEAYDIKEQEWQGGMMFFSVKLVPIKVIKLNQINKENNIQVQACYKNGSKKLANNPLGG